MSSLAGKRAIVTGAASGLGRATSRELAARGAEVVVSDIDEPGGLAVAEELGARFVRCDVASYEDNLALVDAAGPVDLAFLNAGIDTQCGIADDFSIDRYRRAMGTNLDGVVYGTHAVLPALRANGGGAIVATSSLAGLGPDTHDPVYGANKHALVGLTRSLGPVLAGDGIRFNAVCPGFYEAKMVENIRDEIEELGILVMTAESVAMAVIALMEGEMSGECWYVQYGRSPEPFAFRDVPAPRSGEQFSRDELRPAAQSSSEQRQTTSPTPWS